MRKNRPSTHSVGDDVTFLERRYRPGGRVRRRCGAVGEIITIDARTVNVYVIEAGVRTDRRETWNLGDVTLIT
ncbi:MAG: hypothetical protein HY420_02600 [Candidatus Kerfeldbacteria bacterium]|nr:hypothetical protein [Candidatus Kerfeldbacteria bacterium]